MLKRLRRFLERALTPDPVVLRRLRLRRLADRARRKRGGEGDRVRSGRERLTTF
jgi:hypothetical protein